MIIRFRVYVLIPIPQVVPGFDGHNFLLIDDRFKFPTLLHEESDVEYEHIDLCASRVARESSLWHFERRVQGCLRDSREAAGQRLFIFASSYPGILNIPIPPDSELSQYKIVDLESRGVDSVFQ